MERFMEEAIKEARKGINENAGGPFGSVVVKGETIVGRGHNEVLKRQDSTCHGEIMAIRDACHNLGTYDLSGTVLYTTAYPCPMCMGAILWANIDKIYYGCDIKDTEKIGFRDKEFYEMSKEKEKQMFVEISKEKCLELYREYLSKTEAKRY